ncbi:hypothetical protein C8R44DRAFT_786839, partial [Mycena epipterygia]
MSPFISGTVNFLFGTFDFGCRFSFPLPVFAFPHPGYSGIASFMCRPPSPSGASPLSFLFISIPPFEPSILSFPPWTPAAQAAPAWLLSWFGSQITSAVKDGA